MARTFEHAPAVRRSVPVLLGLFGPSGSGKTFTSLRLAVGMEWVTKKPTFFIDTEAGRALHYADLFKFEHVPFAAPFDPLSYLEVFRYCKAQGAGQIIGDSLSHVWEGEDGVLDMHDKETERIAKRMQGDSPLEVKKDRAKMSGWIKPKAEIRQLINGLLQIDCNFIFCFRAKEKMKIVTGKQPQALGFQPIIGDEFPYEMTMNLFLPPASNGVPALAPVEVGEKAMLKIPQQFKPIMIPGRVLDEQIGERLALWAAGGPAGETVKPATREPATEQARATGEGLSLMTEIREVLRRHKLGSKTAAGPVLLAFGCDWAGVCKMDADGLRVGLAALKKNLDGVAALASREPGEDDGE